MRDHLDLLRRAVEAEGGAVVKTMGDAIMAVFRCPVGALRAVLRARHELAGTKLVLKAGIHYGPCIAVNQNDRLDYFGSTVNVAARLAGLSTGSDVVVSAVVAQDAELAGELEGLEAEPLEADLKGFDERFELLRIRPVR